MTENEKIQSTSRDDIYYAALVDAWFANRMEKDRTLLALSAGGLALLVGLVSTSGIRSICHFVLYLLSACAYLLAIYSGLEVFTENSRYLEKEKESFESNGEGAGQDPRLERLDRRLGTAFLIGAILTTAVALVSAWPNESNVEEPMAAERTISTPKTVNKSLSGGSTMRPSQGKGPSGLSKPSGESTGAPSGPGSGGDSGSGNTKSGS